MGLFASRPEEPTEWAGIPSEPLESSPVEHIDHEATSAASLSLLQDGAAFSVTIPLPTSAQPIDRGRTED